MRPRALAALSLVAGAFAVAAWAQPGAEAPAMAVADVERVVGSPRARPLSGAALETRAHQVGALLRCPVCQGLSVADSPSGMAQNMRAQVRDLVAAGFDQEQILSYFERSYGESVRLDPALRGVNWLVWLGPAAGLLAGVAIVARALRRPPSGPVVESRAARSADAPPARPPDAGDLPDDPELARYVLLVRDMARDRRDGRPPRKDQP